MNELPKFIPIITPEAMECFKNLSKYFTHAIIPYYTMIDNEDIPLPKGTIFILSSIMPDELLMEPETIHHFIRVAKKATHQMGNSMGHAHIHKQLP